MLGRPGRTSSSASRSCLRKCVESRAGDLEPDQDRALTIRPATVADQVALAELNAVVQQMHHDIAPEWFKPPELSAIIDFFREALRSDALRTFVVEVDGVVRFAGFRSSRRRP